MFEINRAHPKLGSISVPSITVVLLSSLNNVCKGIIKPMSHVCRCSDWCIWLSTNHIQYMSYTNEWTPKCNMCWMNHWVMNELCMNAIHKLQNKYSKFPHLWTKWCLVRFAGITKMHYHQYFNILGYKLYPICGQYMYIWSINSRNMKKPEHKGISNIHQVQWLIKTIFV